MRYLKTNGALHMQRKEGIMAKFNLDNYELVEDRLKKFWVDFPNGRIETEIVHITDDGTCVTIRALGYKDMEDINPVSTGIAQETKGQGGFANTDAWVENCETSSVGRMLANWNYQGSNKPRPSREEMSKVSQEPTTKKDTVQKTTTSPSKITEKALKGLVLSYCNDDKNFARECYKTTMKRFTISNKVTDDITTWDDTLINKFLELVDIYVRKFKDDFDKMSDNSEVINNTMSILDAKEMESEEDMAEIKEGPWMNDPISDGQKNFIKSLIEQAIDNKLDELAAEGKQYLASGEATKGNASQMIDKLKDALS